MRQIAYHNSKMLRDHKQKFVHLATNNNTPIQQTGIKMATERMAMARPGLIDTV